MLRNLTFASPLYTRYFHGCRFFADGASLIASIGISGISVRCNALKSNHLQTKLCQHLSSYCPLTVLTDSRQFSYPYIQLLFCQFLRRHNQVLICYANSGYTCGKIWSMISFEFHINAIPSIHNNFSNFQIYLWLNRILYLLTYFSQ